MRFNTANEVFCHTATEVKKLIEDRGYGDVYVSSIVDSDDYSCAER